MITYSEFEDLLKKTKASPFDPDMIDEDERELVNQDYNKNLTLEENLDYLISYFEHYGIDSNFKYFNGDTHDLLFELCESLDKNYPDYTFGRIKYKDQIIAWYYSID